ncbi:phosphoadenylyl-sulfate reductase [Aliishimia ponticola]|uniref:Adenosine 5'-phosphosulfate reductase n=1 Tax=Aliishimia ponticola TaxID=2499833 RepID=A0A4S4NGS4_9RHOB|nr:phosphoadenylyl-sulfate reductase [Aliishimia ponticola]THH38829.1 phosphoadenylyl-sulfate reductase [Aliishimia ponticola]
MHHSPELSRRAKQPHPATLAHVAVLNNRYDGWEPMDLLRVGLSELGPVAIVSSFGAESAVLLHMASRIDKSVPVIFIDTEMLFPETLDYQRELTREFGMTGVVVLRAGDAAVHDPDGTLHQRNTDACCALRKTAPLQTALSGFDAWVSGRKRFQSGTRATLEHFEAEAGTGRIKVNPLAHWTASDLQDYMTRHDLPRHPLVAQGYPSIGCAPCTTKVAPGEDPRAGRWRDADKDECGIHFVNGKMVRGGEAT